MYKDTTKMDFFDEETRPKSTLISKNITVNGHRTSVRLEPEMWIALKEISKREKCTVHDICSLISMKKQENTSLTAAIRVFLMLYYRAAATEAGHSHAGHGNIVVMRQRARLNQANDLEEGPEESDLLLSNVTKSQSNIAQRTTTPTYYQ